VKGFPAWFNGLSELIAMNRTASIDIAKALAIGCGAVGHVLEAGVLRGGGGGMRGLSIMESTSSQCRFFCCSLGHVLQ